MKISDTTAVAAFSKSLRDLSQARQKKASVDAELSAASAKLTAAKMKAGHDCGKIAREIDYHCGDQPSASDREAVMDRLSSHIRYFKSDFSRRDKLRSRRQTLETMQANEKALDAALKNLAELEREKEEAVTAMAATKAQAPTADGEAMAAIDTEIAVSSAERERILEKLKEVNASLEGIAASAEETARLDQLEAQAALEGSASGSALTKARKEVAAAEDAVTRLRAQARGLDNLLSEEESKLSDLRSVRNHVAQVIYRDIAMSAEAKLLKYLAGADKIACELKEARVELNKVMKDSNRHYFREIVIQLPQIYGDHALPKTSENLKFRSRSEYHYQAW